MKKIFILITPFSICFMALGQVCPQGTKWNVNAKRCEKVEMPNDMAVVNFKCPNGYSWVSFKRKCLTNQQVKEIYDSLRIEYLKSPELRSSSIANNPIVIPDTPVTPDPVQEQIVVTTVPSTTNTIDGPSITISQADFNELKNELLSLKSEVTEIKETNQQIQQDFITFKTLIDEGSVNNADGSETVIATMSTEDINYLKQEISSFKTQVAQMQELVNKLQEQQTNLAASQGSYTGTYGKQNTSVSKSEIYGQSEVKFKIECPNGYKWLNEESICLKTEVFDDRARAKAADPNASVDYGIRDVKCPKFFLWNSKSQNCIPTLHAAVKE